MNNKADEIRIELTAKKSLLASPVKAFTGNLPSNGGGGVATFTANFPEQLTTDEPLCVLIQTRQSDNADHGWEDQFTVQVMQTTRDWVRCSIMRVDRPKEGWGQSVRIDCLVVEQG